MSPLTYDARLVSQLGSSVILYILWARQLKTELESCVVTYKRTFLARTTRVKLVTFFNRELLGEIGT